VGKVIAVISKIVSMQSSFTVSENEIAQYVMNNAETVVTNTISAIAKKTNTSEASINRFCKKLGFKGFNSFKISLAQDNFFNSSMRENSEGESDGLISSMNSDYRQMIKSTSAMVDESVFTIAAEAVKEARIVYIFSYSSTAFVAGELGFKLAAIGKNAKVVTDVDLMRISAVNIEPLDLAVVIAPTLLTRELYPVVSSCKERGAKVLAITSYDSPKLNSLVDFKFVTSDKITTQNSLVMSNSLMFLFVVDVLFSAMLKDDKAMRAKKLASDAAMRSGQVLDNYMVEY
jgi:DNA-binding MurR/RpiR family transcriptional regulator